MEYDLKEFTEVRGRSVNEPRVTVSKGGNMNLNKSFLDTFVKDKENPTYVIFHYDKTNKVIGLKLTTKKPDNSYRIRISREGKLASVSAQAFLKYNRIGHKKSKAFAAEWNEKYGLIIIDLKAS